MNIQKSELLKDVTISYYKPKSQFYSKAELMIDGYLITLKSEYFETIDEAVSSIKGRIIEAIKKFKPNHNEEL